jgi:uncharacterized protein YqeY
MSLYQKIESDMKEAMRQKDTAKLSVLRMFVSAVKTMQIEKNLRDVPDGEALKILQTQIKQHKESIAQFEKGNRPDLVSKEAAELAVLESYMPRQLTEDEIAAIIKDAISETGAATKQDMGRVMKLVMEKVAGRADGKLVNALVMKMLK